MEKENGAKLYRKTQERVMTEIVKPMYLLGRNISYSFSKGYFTDKSLTETLTAAAMRISIFKK
jgi:hypothetical protein